MRGYGQVGDHQKPYRNRFGRRKRGCQYTEGGYGGLEWFLKKKAMKARERRLNKVRL